MNVLTPARRRGTEILDDPEADPTLSLRSLHDVAKANTLFGGRHAVVSEAKSVLGTMTRGSACTLLDVGTGIGDIPATVIRAGASRGITVTAIGLELSVNIARAAAARGMHGVAADALRLPFASQSIDIVTCSQVLHHFDGEPAAQLLREMTRVARRAVIVGDLRRSWLAVAGLWSSSFLLGFHPVSRHDGIVSILRGYTVEELRQLVQSSTGCTPYTRGGLGFRVVARWAPISSSTPTAA